MTAKQDRGDLDAKMAEVQEQLVRLGAQVAESNRRVAATAEAEARAALRAYHAIGDIEQWLAEQPWERLPGGGGWRVRGQLQSWRFLLEPVSGDGVRVIMSGAGEPPARWVVPAP